MAGLQRAANEFGDHTPPATVIGVSALWSPDFLVEAEVTAVID